jgi:hypothetical protein
LHPKKKIILKTTPILVVLEYGHEADKGRVGHWFRSFFLFFDSVVLYKRFKEGFIVRSSPLGKLHKKVH